MRRALLLSLLSLGLLGCPPPRKPDPPVALPTDEKTDPPGPPRETRPDPNDKPAAPITSEEVTAIINSARGGVITALPKLRVFVKEKRIEIEGATSVKVGPQLELLACSTRGKAYESLLIWLCEPSHLQLALIMIGLTPTPQVESFGEQKELKQGERVVIEVEWTDPVTKKQVRRRVEDLLFDVYRDGCMKYSGFVFTGSRQLDVPQPPDWTLTKKQFASDVTGTVAVTYHDPDAILDTPLAEGGNNTTFVAWEQRLPERHTPIVTHIRAWRAGDEVEPKDALRDKAERRPTGGGSPGGGGGPPPEDEPPVTPKGDEKK